MTWSNSLPRGCRQSASFEALPPVMWAPEELALDTRGLHEAARARATDSEHAPVSPDADADAPHAEALERAVQEAYERGVDVGRRLGEEAESARLRQTVHTVTDALASLHAEADKWVGNAEENVCALAIAVARQVIGREVALDKSALSSMVDQAIGEFPLDQALILRINPLDLQTIHSAFNAMGDASPLSTRQDVQWLPDARIAAGGCLIEGRDRIVDGRVDTALERLYRRLTYTGA